MKAWIARDAETLCNSSLILMFFKKPHLHLDRWVVGNYGGRNPVDSLYFPRLKSGEIREITITVKKQKKGRRQ